MKTIEDSDVVELFKSRLEEELVETVRLIDESREYRAPVELDPQSVGRLSRMDAMQQQARPRTSRGDASTGRLNRTGLDPDP